MGTSKKKPLISFVVPCYNLPVDMLRECIDSILAISLSEDEREIIVVDDGSDESPLPALASYDGNVNYIRQENGGLSAARNTGIAAATGEYIQFVDGDDALILQAYNICLSLLKKEHPDLLLFNFTDKVADYQSRYTATNIQQSHSLSSLLSPLSSKQSHSLSSTTSGTIHLCNHNICASACSYVFRRAILGNLRFPVGLLHEDEEFTPLLLLRADMVVDSGLTAYYYRQRPQSIVHSEDKSLLQKRLDDTEKILSHLQAVAQTLPPDGQAALARRVAQLTMDYIYNVLRKSSTLKETKERIGRLKAQGLYPLPLRRYTWKYWLFSLVANILSPLL